MTGINKKNRHLPLPDVPYRGIRYFRYIDQGIFFAREREIKKLNRLVTMYRGVLLYGSSGVGKSSLVNSGFVPDALQENFIPEKIRVLPWSGSEFVVERIADSVADGKMTYLSSIFIEDENERKLKEDIEEKGRIIELKVNLKEAKENAEEQLTNKIGKIEDEVKDMKSSMEKIEKAERRKKIKDLDLEREIKRLEKKVDLDEDLKKDIKELREKFDRLKE
ncbi:MAG: hypothetical protein JSV88_31105 [Candidatus Aminicenantes bacterium]|nr:MAG: hypothetical protein JSV88_31105 [Candidatus Aminicenantes bacterium]